MLRKSPVLLLVAALCVAPVLLGSEQAHAASTITVDCTTDASALATALASASDGDTLAIQGTCKGTFDIAHNLALTGSAGATLDGQSGGTVLTIGSGKTVGISTLTITGGSPSAADPIGGGIEIDASATFTLADSTVRDNVPRGIANIGGAVAVTRTLVTGNRNGAGFFGLGGGIFNEGSFSPFGTVTGTLTLENSTVSNNTALYGGGLESQSAGVLTVKNSTISGNTAFSGGGAIDFFSSTTNIEFSTITGNSGGFFGGAISGGGGSFTLKGTIVAAQATGGNCAAAVSDGGYNLDDGTSCGFSTANNSLASTNPLLDPAGLQDNGGPTQTIALQPSSPAIDKIPPAVNGCGTTITTDQRGVGRPQGAGCDIGPFEFVPPAGADLAITKSASPNPVLSGNRLTYTLSVSNNGPQDATGVTVSDPLPDSTHFNSVSSSQGTCVRSTTTNPKPKSGTVTCSLGNVANGASATITIIVTATTPGALTNTATVSGNETDPNPGNNNATATTTVTGT